MNKVLGILLVAGLMAVPSAFAEETGPGCGLGQQFFKGTRFAAMGPKVSRIEECGSVCFNQEGIGIKC